MAQTDTDKTLRRIETPLRLTLLGLWAERLCRAFWPLWSLVIAVLAALSLGMQDYLPLEAAWFGLVSAAVGGVWALVHGWRTFHRPTRDTALARLDAALPGQPIAALRDAQATGTADPASVAVWAAHRERMAARAARARTVQPNLKLASRDPYALRYLALTGLLIALMFGSIWRVASVTGLISGNAAIAAAGPSWEGWAQSPAYTGKPTLYLNDITEATLSLPVGTRIQLRLYGEPGALILSETVSGRTEVPPASDPDQNFTVAQSGKISIDGAGGRSWTIAMMADAPPTVAPQGDIEREADGRFRQGFSVKDDYGVTAGQVSIALDLAAVDRRFGLLADPEPQTSVILDLPKPLRGAKNVYSEALVDDLSKHLFANLPVTLTFSVTDAAAQTGASAPLHVVLPGLRFFDPLAASLIELRRDLLWNRSNAARTSQILKAVTHLPDGFVTNQRAFLRLRTVMRELDANQIGLTPEKREELTAELWEIALLVENGDLASALERLRRAQDHLDEAIRNGADPAEIDKLMQELREATNDYIRQLAEEAKRNGTDEPQTSENTQSMSQDQLQQMMDELQKLMKEGRTAEAAELAEKLRQFMENMRVTEGGKGNGQGSPNQQAMKNLGQTLRDQQDLSDDSFRDMQKGQQGEGGQTEPKPGENGQGQNGQNLADRQKDLSDQLGGINREGRLPGAGTPEGEAGRQELDRAGRAMTDAERALRQDDLPGALDSQAQAMEALRNGIQKFAEAQSKQDRRTGTAQSGQAPGMDNPSPGKDPLGRDSGQSAHIGSDRNLLQGEDVYRRAQNLLDEIRRRSGEQARPENERSYLKRLLDLF